MQLAAATIVPLKGQLAAAVDTCTHRTVCLTPEDAADGKGKVRGGIAVLMGTSICGAKKQ